MPVYDDRLIYSLRTEINGGFRTHNFWAEYITVNYTEKLYICANIYQYCANALFDYTSINFFPLTTSWQYPNNFAQHNKQFKIYVAYATLFTMKKEMLE